MRTTLVGNLNSELMHIVSATSEKNRRFEGKGLAIVGESSGAFTVHFPSVGEASQLLRSINLSRQRNIIILTSFSRTHDINHEVMLAHNDGDRVGGLSTNRTPDAVSTYIQARNGNGTMT